MKRDILYRKNKIDIFEVIIMDSGCLETLILTGFVVMFLCFYFYATWNHDYWTKRGVPGPKPSVPFGNFSDFWLRRKSLTEMLQDLYNAYESEPYFGYFVNRMPTFVLNDPDLIKQVLVKDFDMFPDRGIKINEDIEPLSAHLVNIEGQRWKVLRNKLTPVFTSSKLKQMLHSMVQCADNLEIFLKKSVTKNQLIECREFATRYSTDVIGSCAFGIDTQALVDKNSVFHKFGCKIFHVSFISIIKRLMRSIAPGVYSFLRLSTTPRDVVKFFITTMKETIEQRKLENIIKDDFVDVLMNIREDSKTDGFEWTDHLLTAQAYVFFTAGLETSSVTISFALWELARAPEVQEKLRQEILETERKNGGNITCDAINTMKYLDMVLKETLRKNPPVTLLVRKLKQDYVIPGTNLLLPCGQHVQVLTYALHHDPKYYPNPEVFDPERFTDEAKKSRDPMVYLPFGAGPKNCIGARFAYYQMKLALIKVLKNFSLHPTTKTDEPYKIEKSSVFLCPVGGIILRFERISA